MELKNVSKVYNSGKKNEVAALKGVSVSFKKGKFYAIMGRSGSGKSTLVNIMGLLDTPTEGEYRLNNKNTSSISENEKASLRNNLIGFVFQDFYLDENLTAKENILLPLLINKKCSQVEREQKALSLMETFDIKDRANHYPKELSGGEQQRVAIARALANDPEIIIADEPTGNLDSNNEKKIFEVLKEISKSGKCVIVVSHNELIKEYCDVLFKIDDGELIKDEK